jgi:outer membrane protein assembly factor BamB
MKRLKKGSVLAVILALMVTLTAFVLPTAYVSAEGELVNVTFVVTGSRILTKKTDHATAYDDGAWVDEAVTGLDSNKTVADVTLQQLDNEVAGRSVTIISSAYGSFLSSITVDGKTNTGGVTNGRNSYWQLLINGTPANMGMDAITVNEGDRIEWKFINDPTFPLSVEQETADPALTLSPTPDYWTSFASSSLHNAAKTIKGTLENNFKLLWSKPYGEKSEWGGYVTKSDFMIIGDHLYFAAGGELFKVNGSGEVVAKEKLRNTIGYFGRLAYDYGLVVVPLDGGAVQAIDAKTMKTKWVAEAQDLLTIWAPNDKGVWQPTNHGIQSLATLLIADEVAYSTTTAVVKGAAPGGIIRAIDMATGETLWQYQNSTAGYYWAGPVKIGKWLVIGNDGGALEVIDADEGKQLAANTEQIGAPIRSTIVHADEKLYFTSRDGKFHEISFNKEDGSFGKLRSVQFGKVSTSTPTIYGGKAYVGGALAADWGSDGVFAVIDLATMAIDFQHVVKEGDVKSAPLVIAGDEGHPFVFFTANNATGALYVYDGKAVTMAYEPDEEEQKNYSTSSAVTDGKERIYYTNDSGHVFAIQMSKKTISPEGEGIPPTGETRDLLFAGLLLVTLAVGFVYAANKKRQATVSDD